MMTGSERKAYAQVTEAFKRSRKGCTIADVAAKTALPVETVRRLAPQVADEYRSRLEVTESGEILYSFPHGFTSRYRGLFPFLRRAGGVFLRGLRKAAVFAFKVWIMVMLVGYFVLFLLLALAAIAASLAGSKNSKSNNSGNIAGSILNFMFRMWFWSNVFDDSRYYRGARPQKAQKEGGPLYKSIFSFVFGEGDPRAAAQKTDIKNLIAYIQAHDGVIAEVEFMLLTGCSAQESGQRLLSFCAKYGGLPEATDDGTVVYRFDDLLKRHDSADRSFSTGNSAFTAPLRRRLPFSANKASKNAIFAAINGVNLLCGGYFLTNALNTGEATMRVINHSAHYFSAATGEAASYFYGFVYHFFSGFTANPLSAITFGLGWTPLVFSLLFWLIPLLRAAGLPSKNAEICRENLRKAGFGAIWASPLSVTEETIPTGLPELRVKGGAEEVIREMGAYSPPLVSIEGGKTVYTFKDLDEEKKALAKFREKVSAENTGLGKVVFSTE